MEEQELYQRNKGGRPRKTIKKDQLLAVKCTREDRQSIIDKALKSGLTLSEFLLEMALTGKIDCHKKTLPREVLNLTATLNHMAANLNQLARRRNGPDELNALERTRLKQLCLQLKNLALDIKSHVK